MKNNIPDYISYPVISTFLGLLLFPIPFIGVLLFLPLMPLANIYDMLIPGEFGQTGHHVEIGFAWITPHTIEAWLFYGSFFFLVGLGIGSFKYCYSASKLKQWFGGVVVLSGLIFALVNFLNAL